MKKSFLFKGVSILGAVLLLANVSLSGLVAYAKEAESTGSEATLVYDVIYNAETYTALYAGNETLLASLDAYNGEEGGENFPWVVIQTPAEGFSGTIKFDYLGGEGHEYTGDTSKAPFGKHPIITGGEYLVKSIPVAFDDETLKDDGFDSDKLTISHIPEVFEELTQVEGDEGNWYFVKDADSFDKAYDNGDGPLGKYYESYPEEGLWHVGSGRVCNSNDKSYKLEIYSDLDGNNLEYSGFFNSDGDEYWRIVNKSDSSEVYYIHGNPNNMGNEVYQLYSSVTCVLPDGAITGSEVPAGWVGAYWDCNYTAPAVNSGGTCVLPSESPVGATIPSWTNAADGCVYVADGAYNVVSANKSVKLGSLEYSDECVYSWSGAGVAYPGSYPWIIGDLDLGDSTAKFEWKYEDGEDPADWISIEENADASKDYRMISIPQRFGDKFALNGDTDFDLDKFSVKLLPTPDPAPVEIIKATHEVTVSFESDGGGDVEGQTIELGQKVTEPNPAPTKDGYTLSGWQKCTDESTCTDFDFNTAVTEDTILKAKWAKTETKTSGGSSGGGGGGGSSKITQSDTKATTGDNAKLDDTKADETKSEENNDEDKVAPMTEAQAVEKFGQEQIDAYKWALENGITTMKTVEAARLDEPLTRAELAKMMVVYIQKVLEKDPILTGDVNYSDVGEELGDLFGYIKLAYQYQIMGINADGTPIELFNPYGIVSRGEYATVFSRVLFGNKFNKEGEDFYTNHLEALKAAGILTNTIPSIQEMRGWVMLMMYRSSQNGEAIEKVANTTEENKDEVVKADETASEETVSDETSNEESEATVNEEEKSEEETNTGETTGDTTEESVNEESSETPADTVETTETTPAETAEADTGDAVSE